MSGISRGRSLTITDNGNADEIDLVLSHSRDEEHANDEKDIPQTNLVSICAFRS